MGPPNLKSRVMPYLAGRMEVEVGFLLLACNMVTNRDCVLDSKSM